MSLNCNVIRMLFSLAPSQSQCQFWIQAHRLPGTKVNPIIKLRTLKHWQNMQFSRIKLGIVTLIDKLILACLLILGCYFIHQGDVLGRFRLKRTNFAEYGEPIMEFPTITIFINHRNTPQHLRLGSDYNMTFWTFGYKFAAGWEKTNLAGQPDLPSLV